MTSPDPRDYPLAVPALPRDGAVDPLPGDFLGPTNAGAAGQLGNPHGPSVVSPEVHASQGAHPVTPGPVSSTAATQDAAEKAHLAASLPSAASGWAATTAYALGSRSQVSGGVLEVTTAGTSGATAPAAPGAVGGTVVDSTVTWKRVA